MPNTSAGDARTAKLAETHQQATRRHRPRLSVLFVSRKWPPAVGGMETYSTELVSALRKRHLSVESLVLPGRRGGAPPSLLRLVLFFLRAAWHLCRHGGHCDVVHFADPVLFPLAWWHRLFSSSAAVMSAHGRDMVYQRGPAFAARLYGVFLRWAAQHRRCVDLYIANSWSTASLMKEAGFWPVRVVKLGVSVPPTPASRARQSRAQEGPYLLFVGRLVPRKGAAWFVERVLPLLPAEVRLKLAGVAWDGAELAAIQRLPRARWLGPVSKERLADLYAGSVATVMPNMPTEDGDDVEGFGLVALEAAAHGSVPIAARLQGLEDAVRHGENGFLVQPGQPGAWRRAIMEVLQWSAEDRRRFTCRARRTLERHYTWDRVAERTEEAYRAGINSRDPHGID